MNPYKLRAIIEGVRAKCPLPVDRFGNTLSPADLIVWFGLDECLSYEEQGCVEIELALMIEAEAVMDRLRAKAT